MFTVYKTDQSTARVSLAGIDSTFQISGAKHSAFDAVRSVDVRRFAHFIRQQWDGGRLQLDGVRCAVKQF